jgi:hypothetical protein
MLAKGALPRSCDHARAILSHLGFDLGTRETFGTGCWGQFIQDLKSDCGCIDGFQQVLAVSRISWC